MQKHTVRSHDALPIFTLSCEVRWHDLQGIYCAYGTLEEIGKGGKTETRSSAHTIHEKYDECLSRWLEAVLVERQYEILF